MLHILTGTDEYAIEQRALALKGDAAPMNVEVVRGTDLKDLHYAIITALTQSLSGEPRVVWMQQAPLKEAVTRVKSLTADLGNVSRSQNRLILCSETFPDRRTKVVKELLKLAVVETFDLPSQWDRAACQQAVQTAATAAGVELAPNLLELLEPLGLQPRRLVQEMAKLSLYSEVGFLTTETVQSLIELESGNALEFSKALVQRNLTAAMSLLPHFGEGEGVLRTVRTLNSQFRLWYYLSCLIREGKADAAIASQLKLGNPRRMYFLRKEVSGSTPERLMQCLQAILETEWKLKTGQEDSLRGLVLAIAGS